MCAATSIQDAGRTRRPTVVFAGGGTAGHLFPGLAVAERLAADAPDLELVFAGAGKPLEERIVRQAGFDYLAIPCRAAPRRLRDVPSFLKSTWSALRTAQAFLAERQPVAIVGLGGYASVPMARAALRRGVPLVLLEQNAIPGRANLWLARRATILCAAFAEVKHYLPAECDWRMTGNPLRDGFAKRSRAAAERAGGSFHGPHAQGGLRAPWAGAQRDFALEPSGGPAAPRRARQLVILGGSSGARWLNTHVPPALARLRARIASWRIVHQTGEEDFKRTAALYRRLKIEAAVSPFISDMAGTLSASDLAVCRAGGTTLAELAVCGVPAVLVPYPYAAADHQRKNAEVFVEAGGCLLLDERGLGGDADRQLAGLLLPLIRSGATREIMGRAMARMATPEAAWDIATMIRRMVPPALRGGKAAERRRTAA